MVVDKKLQSIEHFFASSTPNDAELNDVHEC